MKKPRWTKRDYEASAMTIKTMAGYNQVMNRPWWSNANTSLHELMVIEMVAKFQADNPAFDPERFAKAAGILKERSAFILREDHALIMGIWAEIDSDPYKLPEGKSGPPFMIVCGP